MITNAAMRKELQEEKAKISLMKQDKVAQYANELIDRMCKIVEKENLLFSKKAYGKITEENAWEKVKISNLFLHCSELISSGGNLDNLKLIEDGLTKLMLMIRQNKIHITKAANLREMISGVQVQDLIDDAGKTFGYDENAELVSLKDPLKYMQPINTSKYT
jgi:hypothetical protein